jgi:archaellum biogenesis ATPase FlaH
MSTNERVMNTSNDDDFKTAIENMHQLRTLCDEEEEIIVFKPKRLNDDFKTAIENLDQLRALCNEEIIVFKTGILP